VTGSPAKCEVVKNELLAQIPITEVVRVPFDFHKNLIGRGGKEIRRLMQDYNVSISIPPQDLHSDEITVEGSPTNVRDVVELINSRVEEYENMAKDRELRSFQARVVVPAEFHSRIIGPRGSTVGALRSRFDVNIKVPVSNSEAASPSEHSTDDVIIIGYEKNANDCKAEIERMISEFKALCTSEITLDCRVHPRLIGQKGRNIRKIMDQYGVEIRFPRMNDADPNLVVVAGKSEEAVFDCIDHLRNLEEEYLQDTANSFIHVREAEQKPIDQVKEITFRNAPWQAPVGGAEMQQEFPALGESAGSDGLSRVPLPSWGPRRY